MKILGPIAVSIKPSKFRRELSVLFHDNNATNLLYATLAQKQFHHMQQLMSSEFSTGVKDHIYPRSKRWYEFNFGFVGISNTQTASTKKSHCV